jgi:hypothetical protein
VADIKKKATIEGVTAVTGVAPGKGQLASGLLAFLAKRKADRAAGIKPVAKVAKLALAGAAVQPGICAHCGQPLPKAVTA